MGDVSIFLPAISAIPERAGSGFGKPLMIGFPTLPGLDLCALTRSKTDWGDSLSAIGSTDEKSRADSPVGMFTATASENGIPDFPLTIGFCNANWLLLMM